MAQKYFKHKGKSSEELNTLENEFEATFNSIRNRTEIETC